MKALTIWQPWAILIAIGAKKIETRSWSTRYRGPLVIHAAKTRRGINSVYDGWIWQMLYDAGYENELALPLGCVVATCNLVTVEPVTSLFASDLQENEIELGDYTPGQFAWMLEDIVKVVPPIPAQGRQGLWNIAFEDEVSE